jgi:AAA15 family ATPase/GTPase
MLISLKIKNFRSIKKEIIIDTTKYYSNDSPDLKNNSFKVNELTFLKSLVLFGRNASGKSNILMSFYAIQYLLRMSDKFKHGELLKPYEPYLFEKSIIGNPVEFEIIFFAKDNIKYRYSIKFNKERVTYESLYFWPEGVESKLFERKLNKFSYGTYFKGEKVVIEKELLENQLFLSKSATKNFVYLKEAYLFLTKYLYVSTIHAEEYDRLLINSACEFMYDDDSRKENMKILLKAADTSVLDFTIDKLDEKKFKLPDNVPDDLKKTIMRDFMYQIKTYHNMFENGKKIGIKDLSLNYESLGTRKLIAVSGLILDALLDGSVLIIDELDKSLHPILTKMLISLFHTEKNNPNNAQLIFATHDSSLLDNTLFDREQILFVDKEYEGNTISYKLRDIKGVRKDIPFEKWYLNGKFSAIPVLSDVELLFNKNNDNNKTQN